MEARSYTCVHGVEQRPEPADRFGALSPCPDCRASGEQWQAEVEEIERQLRERLAADDPLHPDNYQGPYGSLWYQAVGWLLAEPAPGAAR